MQFGVDAAPVSNTARVRATREEAERNYGRTSTAGYAALHGFSCNNNPRNANAACLHYNIYS